MDRHRIRNLLPPLYALLILVGFLISSDVGVIVLIVGAVVSGLLWTALSRGGNPHETDRSDR